MSTHLSSFQNWHPSVYVRKHKRLVITQQKHKSVFPVNNRFMSEGSVCEIISVMGDKTVQFMIGVIIHVSQGTIGSHNFLDMIEEVNEESVEGNNCQSILSAT